MTGEAPLVDVTTAAVGGHISAEELSDLPSASRNYMAFVGNVPGTVFIPSAEFLNDSFQANGQPTAANNIVFDGANNTDEQRGSNVGGQTRAANESIAEVQILTNQFDAEWGRASGAVINAVTKSGTNQFTGSAFNFYTSKAMTNRDFFAKARMPRSRTSARKNGAARSAARSSGTSCTSSAASSDCTSTAISATRSRRVPRSTLPRRAKSRRGTPCGASTIS